MLFRYLLNQENTFLPALPSTDSLMLLSAENAENTTEESTMKKNKMFEIESLLLDEEDIEDTEIPEVSIEDRD